MSAVNRKLSVAAAAITYAVGGGADAAEMTGWKVIASGSSTDGTICYDPEIDRAAREVICYVADRGQTSAFELLGILSLIVSLLFAAAFIAYKRGKFSKEEFYSQQSTNVWVGWCFLSILMFVLVSLKVN